MQKEGEREGGRGERERVGEIEGERERVFCNNHYFGPPLGHLCRLVLRKQTEVWIETNLRNGLLSCIRGKKMFKGSNVK